MWRLSIALYRRTLKFYNTPKTNSIERENRKKKSDSNVLENVYVTEKKTSGKDKYFYHCTPLNLCKVYAQLLYQYLTYGLAP